MKDSYLSTQKKTTMKGMTNHKSQYSFAPEEDTIQKSNITLKESQLLEK